MDWNEFYARFDTLKDLKEMENNWILGTSWDYVLTDVKLNCGQEAFE